MALDAAKREQVKQSFQQFLLNRANAIRKLQIEDLNINPFLIRILAKEMGFSDARSIVRWLVNQRLERGTVTSFGIALQDAAKVFSEGTGVEGADILKTKEDRHYYIQVKSGPNTIPKDLGVRISQLLRSAQRRNRGSVALFGMCYGNQRQVSSIVRKYVEQEGGIAWLTGREFWEFISDDPNCIDEIYAVVAEVGEEFRDPQGQTLSEILDAKIDELTSQFKELYGEKGETMWQNLLVHNS
ncbi:MAG: PmeII family type II restriction endonuclease [Anaerolineae bacterium]|nr:PmeII family type II restriction endonuclease [Anaerolineae bacterium]